MPNWVTTRGTIKGNHEEIERLISTVASVDENGKGTDLSFNNIIPMPKTLSLPCGSMTLDFVKAYLSTATVPVAKKFMEVYNATLYSFQEKLTVDEIFEGITDEVREHLQGAIDADDNIGSNYSCVDDRTIEGIGKAYVDNILNYGSTTWYDWRVAHWGTKWDACDVCMDRTDDDELSVSFDTAWSFPYNVLLALAEKFPTLSFEWKYADEDFGYNCGEVSFEGGENTYINIPEEYCPELAEEVLGWSPEELDGDSTVEGDESAG